VRNRQIENRSLGKAGMNIRASMPVDLKDYTVM
jgi:hypothetical protein